MHDSTTRTVGNKSVMVFADAAPITFSMVLGPDARHGSNFNSGKPAGFRLRFIIVPHGPVVVNKITGPTRF